MPVVIESLANRHLEGLYAAINAVAGERIYLGRFSLAPFEESAKFFQSLIDRDEAAFVAQADDAVVGWCDIIAIDREPQRHVGFSAWGLLLAIVAKVSAPGCSLLRWTNPGQRG